MRAHPPSADQAAQARPADAQGIVDAVVIGRNEGARLQAALQSLEGAVRCVVYVDSGSGDGSPDLAREAGARVVALDMTHPFTAARARNEGLAHLPCDPPARYVQFMDGDCTLRDGWIRAARAYLDSHPQTAVICGRRRERHPEASVYNRLCDREWNTPPGPARACGGDAMMRREALNAVGGFRADLIAGEEPELCLRLREAGWHIHRLDTEMTWHDAQMTRFAQWWKRSRRAGHAFAEGAALHGTGPDRHYVRETRRALIWGIGVPATAAALAAFHPAGAAVVLAWPAQVLRLALRDRDGHRAAWEHALFTVLGKLPEAVGVLEYHAGRLRGRRRSLIEYR